MTTTKTMDIKLERTIPAPAAEVFDAWLDPNTPVNPFSGAKKLIFDLKQDALFNFVHHHEGREDTLVSLTHANLPDDDYGRAHDGGWKGYMNKLAALFPAGA